MLRNKLANSEMAASKELQHAELRKELEKSRTIGIMSYCKENSVFVEKEITRLAEQLLDKNIAIEAYVKEIEKMKKSA